MSAYECGFSPSNGVLLDLTSVKRCDVQVGNLYTVRNWATLTVNFLVQYFLAHNEGVFFHQKQVFIGLKVFEKI